MMLIQRQLSKKYMISRDYFFSKLTSNIMYNEPKNLVSVFKDYLIFDDFSEYLKRHYRYDEAKTRLPKVYDFYESYSKVFPNYVAVTMEARFMFKNIERKQKVIDQRNKRLQELEEPPKEKKRSKVSTLFDENFRHNLTLISKKDYDETINMLERESQFGEEEVYLGRNSISAYQEFNLGLKIEDLAQSGK